MSQPLGAAVLILLKMAQPLAQTLEYMLNAWLKAAEQFVFHLAHCNAQFIGTFNAPLVHNRQRALGMPCSVVVGSASVR